jgi:hypothetical protein
VAALADGSPPTAGGEFIREVPAPNATALRVAGKTQSAPEPSSLETLRALEPAAPVSPAQPTAAAQQISVRIAPPQAPAVDIQMIGRGGQVRVAVRTADGGLETSLRQELGVLVNSLERSGFRAETLTLREALPQTAGLSQMNSQDRQESPSGSGGKGGNFGEKSQSSSQDSSQNPDGGQPQRRSPDRRSPQWIEELEDLA